MSAFGHIFKLFNHGMGPLGDMALVVLAIVSMWLGYRYSRHSSILPSIRQAPESSDGQ